jgi:hypothetical protein
MTSIESAAGEAYPPMVLGAYCLGSLATSIESSNAFELDVFHQVCLHHGQALTVCPTDGVTPTGIRPDDFVLVDEETELPVLHLTDTSDTVDRYAELMLFGEPEECLRSSSR